MSTVSDSSTADGRADHEAVVAQTDTLVVGAGPAGLAMSACLTYRGVRHIVVEATQRVGSSWRNHYERLHLHTSKVYSNLPHVPFSSTAPEFIPRADVVEYLDKYARTFNIEPHFGVCVESIAQADGVYHVDTNLGRYIAQNVVVATGINRDPHVPRWRGDDTYAGTLIHSSDYRSGARFSGKRVLVVGAGNSGAEIALDLFEQGAASTMSIRGPIHVTRRELLGRPTQHSAMLLDKLPSFVADRISLALLWLAVGDLRKYGIRRPKEGPITQVRTRGRIPLIDVGTVREIRRGMIQVRPGIDRFTEQGVVFSDGRASRYDAVVLATGYRPALEFIDDIQPLVNERGLPEGIGDEPARDGLYFIGYGNPLTGALYEIQRQAPQIVEHIVARGTRDS